MMRRPSWSRPFIEDPDSKHDDSHEPKATFRTRPAVLVLLSIAGLLLDSPILSVFDATGVASLALWVIVLVAALKARVVSIAILGPVIAVLCLQALRLYDRTGHGAGLETAFAAMGLGNALIALIIATKYPFKDPAKLSLDGISPVYSQPSDTLRSPEDNLSLWQWMSVSWMTPLMHLGKQRKLEPADVWRLPYEFQHALLHEAFRSLKGGVVWRLFRANWIDLAIMTMLALVELAANYSIPLLLQQLLRAMQSLSLTKRPALLYTFLIFALRFVATQSAVFSLWYSRRCYERSRGEMITMIYEKTLQRKIVGGVGDDKNKKADVNADNEPTQISTNEPQVNVEETDSLLTGQKSKAPGLLRRFRAAAINFLSMDPFGRTTKTPAEERKPATMGKILNLMRNDVYEVAQRFWEFPNLINQPVGLILSFVLIWQVLGWSCLVGIGVVVVSQMGSAVIAKYLVRWETKRRLATDTKLHQITQYIEAIRHLRYYAWQEKWLSRIMDARQTELNLRIITGLWTCGLYTMMSLGNGLLPVAAFWAFTAVKGQQLTVDIAFPALALFSMLQQNLRTVPSLITTLTNAYVAVCRIEDFMSEPDKEGTENKGISFGEDFETVNAVFAWPGRREPVLRDLSLTFPAGLTLMYGQVAAGKSALLQALLGELDLISGKLIRPSASVAYCQQTPWLESATIRDNVLFGGVYNDERYKATLHACALLQDLAALQHGDLSPIGENGIGLSGGQKMRVALARAVYSHADTLLLDDPLSALDQQTAEHIVRECIQGRLMRGRTVILVTHRVDLCIDVAEQIIEIVNGEASVHERDQVPSETALSPSATRTSDAIAMKERDEAAAVPEKFEEEEHRADGNVQSKVYWEFVKAAGVLWFFAVLVATGLERIINLAESWYLKEWSEAYADAALTSWSLLQRPLILAAEAKTPLSRFFERFPNPTDDPQPWLIGLVVIVFLETGVFLFAMVFAIIVTYKAGRNLFRRVMIKVSSTTFRFYDVTPAGRLMNRLTSDIGMVDGGVSDVLMSCIYQIASWVSALIVIAFVTPSFLVAVLVLTAAYLYTISQFIPTSQSLRRLEMVSLSPLMSNFGALLEGLMTVRAFCVQPQFQERIIRTTDAFQQMDHFYWSLQAWLMYRFDLLSATSTVVLTIIAIFSGLSPGLTAFVLVASDRLVKATHALCKSYGKLQLEFVAVERVIELLYLDQEDPGKQSPPASWPSTKDDIVFEEVTIKYAPHLEPSLSDVSFTIPGGTSTALIGRTGSGKSTLALALLATTPPDSGRITIGGIDISLVSKQALRERITFLAQDPVLFPGSLRHNLDPTEDYTDAECISVIDRVCGNFGFKLETEVDTGGKNLSQGQRQLVGLARALLRRSSIIIMDEATASIDKDTAWEIQRVLREELAGSTVITIAHRPSAVRGADLCLKLADGKLAAMGKPDEIVPGEGQSVAGAAQDVI